MWGSTYLQLSLFGGARGECFQASWESNLQCTYNIKILVSQLMFISEQTTLHISAHFCRTPILTKTTWKNGHSTPHKLCFRSLHLVLHLLYPEFDLKKSQIFFLNTRQYKWSISSTRCSAENFRICMLNHPTGNFGLNLQLCYGNQIKHIQKTHLEMYSWHSQCKIQFNAYVKYCDFNMTKFFKPLN